MDDIYEFYGDSSTLINSVIKKKEIIVNDYEYIIDKSNAIVSISSRTNRLTKRNIITGETQSIYVYEDAGFRVIKISAGIILFISVFTFTFVYITNKKKIDIILKNFFR